MRWVAIPSHQKENTWLLLNRSSVQENYHQGFAGLRGFTLFTVNTGITYKIPDTVMAPEGGPSEIALFCLFRCLILQLVRTVAHRPEFTHA